MLTGGDRRSIGKANQVVALLKSQPEHLSQLVRLLWDRDSLVSMRAADVVEKVSRGQGNLLQPYRAQLLGLLAECSQQEVRWHLAVMVPRLRLTVAECRRVADLLEKYLGDRSSIVKTSAMQGLFDLTRQDAELRPRVTELIHVLARTGTPAMRARGRHLLKQLEVKGF